MRIVRFWTKGMSTGIITALFPSVLTRAPMSRFPKTTRATGLTMRRSRLAATAA